MCDADWSLLDREGVDDIARRAAGMVVGQYGEAFDVDDLHQDARILIATNPQVVKSYLDDNSEGYLSRWLVHRLTDSVRTQARRNENTIGIHRLYEVAE